MTRPSYKHARAFFAYMPRDDRIASIAEHYNALIVQEKLIPAMKAVMAKGA